MADSGALREQQKMLAPIAKELAQVAELRPVGEWMVNIAHWQGLQYAEWLPDRRMLVYQEKYSREGVRVVENRMMPVIEKRIAVILNQVRIPQVVPPAAMSIEERNRIEMSNALIRWLSLSELGDKRNYELMLRFLSLTGTGANIEWWDAKAGRRYGTAATEIYAEGKHAREVVNTFDLFPQPNKVWVDQMDHISLRRLSSVEEIEQNYGGAKVEPDRNMSGVSAADWQIRNLGNLRFGPAPTETVKYVYVYLQRPSEKYPEGREIHFTMLNKEPERMLYAGPNPNPEGELQVAIVSEVPCGLGWSTSIATQLRLNNISYNGLLSSIIGYVKNSVKHTVLAEATQKVDAQQFTEQTKNSVQVVHWDGSENATPPHEFAHPGVPAGAFQTLEALDKGRADIAHQHETMQGGVPGQLRSQPAVQEVRETDLLPLQPLIERVQEAVLKVDTWRLRMAKKWFTEARAASVMSDANRWKSYSFLNARMSDSTELYFPAVVDMPLSLDGKLNALAKIASLNVMPPRMLSEMIANTFHIDRIEEVASMDREPREVQRGELELFLLQGRPVAVNAWDDDAIHQEEIDRFRTREWKHYMELSDEIRAAIQDHWDAHEVQSQQKMLEAVQKQELARMAAMPPEAAQGAQAAGEPAAGAEMTQAEPAAA